MEKPSKNELMAAGLIKDPNTGMSTRSFELVFYIGLLIAFVVILLHADSTHLEKIQSKGEIVVLTRNGPTTYYEGSDGETGLEYDLATEFSKYLGVKLKMVVPDHFSDILPILSGGQADLAAAGLTITDARKQLVLFSQPYQSIRQQLIYRSGENKRPKTLEDTYGKVIEVIADSSHAEQLQQHKAKYNELEWHATEKYSFDDLVYRVYNRDIDFTIVDSNEFKISRRYYPQLRVAFSTSEEQHLAWAFAKNQDESLYNAANLFFNEIKNNGTLTQLLERHYGHIRKFNYVETTVFLEHIENRLPEYKSTFIEAAERYNMDWRLLASMAYQESHWQSNAASPTGVRGIMMLTLKTAGQLDISNRLDSRASIMGGAEYYSILKEKLPARISEPDHTWMAIAAYNVGFGHLEDARILTQSRGSNPDKWIDVKENLPLLSQKKWYKKTKYGYARGREPVDYVRNIRGYFDVLIWLDERMQNTQKEEETFDATTILPESL